LKKKIVVGITGGIGSGKSIVSDIIENAGFNVIRADLIAKQLMMSNKSLIKKIKRFFSNESYDDEKLNTIFLAKKVFGNKPKLKKLNLIVHPFVIKEIKKQIKFLHRSNQIVFVESALIYEANIEAMFDFIVLIYSNKAERIRRIRNRNGLKNSEILKRMKMQMPDLLKKSKAHFVIENNSSVESLKEKTAFLINLISNYDTLIRGNDK
jgi:dephospho-CoA kinase